MIRRGKLIRSIDTRPHNGINRVVWPLSYQPAAALNLITPVEGSDEGGGGRGNATVTVAPGTYRVDVQDYAHAKTLTQKVQVLADPRMKADAAWICGPDKSGVGCAKRADRACNSFESDGNDSGTTACAKRGTERSGRNAGC